MDLAIDRAALQRRRTTQLAVKLLEAAIAEALGFHVQIMATQLWASPGLLDAERIPERYLRLPVPADAKLGPVVPVSMLKQIEQEQLRLMPAPHLKAYKGGRGRAARYE